MQTHGITIKNKPTHSNTHTHTIWHSLTVHTQALAKCYI